MMRLAGLCRGSMRKVFQTRPCTNSATPPTTPAVPEVVEPKEKLWRRMLNHLKMVLEDYKMVIVETGQDMKERPIKASIYIGLLAGAIYLGKTNPSETSYREQLIVNSNELLQVGDPIRNPVSESHMKRVTWCYNTGQMRCLNLGVVSLMWQDNYSQQADVYPAHCKPLKVGWLELHHRVLDVGVAGRWWWIEDSMKDYDINPTEWPQENNNKSTT